MNNQHEIIKKVGGLNTIKDLFQKLALDDVYWEETGKWYSGRYWQENMKGKTGILFDHVVSAFMLSDIIVHIGGTFSGELTYFNGEREIRRLLPLESAKVANYDQYYEYATQEATQIKLEYEVYRVEPFVRKNIRKLFLVSTDLFKDKDKLFRLVEENWKFGYKV
ncbi:hypothetical protein [Acinetobacter baumannii]|uniref:hypothetical protein n=1 Tax=Acinetobacter baumannii TaxID=470 RepID=UPI0022217AEA|nr:hypothetical protein [Acinetobacter baumannii]MCW1497058.1 hypothetical protein [Acinetobacter baumannii]